MGQSVPGPFDAYEFDDDRCCFWIESTLPIRPGRFKKPSIDYLQYAHAKLVSGEWGGNLFFRYPAFSDEVDPVGNYGLLAYFDNGEDASLDHRNVGRCAGVIVDAFEGLVYTDAKQVVRVNAYKGAASSDWDELAIYRIDVSDES